MVRDLYRRAQVENFSFTSFEDAIVIPASDMREDNLTRNEMEQMYIMWYSVPDNESFDSLIRRCTSLWQLAPRDDAILGHDCSYLYCNIHGMCKHALRNALDLGFIDFPNKLCFEQLGSAKKRGRLRKVGNCYTLDAHEEDTTSGEDGDDDDVMMGAAA